VHAALVRICAVGLCLAVLLLLQWHVVMRGCMLLERGAGSARANQVAAELLLVGLRRDCSCRDYSQGSAIGLCTPVVV
jgi:hypothetical protein